MVKVCNCANPTQVGFVHMYEPCFLVTLTLFCMTPNREPLDQDPGNEVVLRFWTKAKPVLQSEDTENINESLKATRIIKSLISL